MVRQTLTLSETLRILNELVQLDAKAMHNLIEQRVPCNETLAYHPEVQVVGEGSSYQVGFLGVLNGLFGTLGSESGDKEGWGPIAAVYNDQGELIEFARTNPVWGVLNTKPLES